MTWCGLQARWIYQQRSLRLMPPGTLVIFVGAGVSRNPPSDLPLFDGLAQQIARRAARTYDGEVHPDIYLEDYSVHGETCTV